MESKKTIEDIYNNYLNYLENKNDDFLKEYQEWKIKNDSIWIDFLDIFIKYEKSFPYSNIINYCFIDNELNYGVFLTYFLNKFIDYFQNSNIQIKKVSSLAEFIFSCIIIDKDDKIDNYKNIKSNLKNIDDYYEKDLIFLFDDFKKSCIDFIENKKININLKYYIKVLDFISSIRKDNINDKLFNALKELFFDNSTGEIISQLEKNLNNYKDLEINKENILLILKGIFSSIKENEYLKFIRKCFNSNIEISDNNFIFLYFDLLNKEKLITYINNSTNLEIKNYDLSKILSETLTNNEINIIEDDIEIKNEKDEIIVNENIDSLKKDLTDFTIKDYFLKQINKYFKSDEKNNFSKYIKDKNYIFSFNNINEEIFPLIYQIYSDLIKTISEPSSNYYGDFGLTVINKKEYIYSYYKEEIIENIIFNGEKLRKFEYSKILECENLSELERSEGSQKSYKSGNKKYRLTYFKGFEFENNSNYLFKNLFELDYLPNYFFLFSKNGEKYEEHLTFSEYNKSLFTSFVETDGAYINKTNKTLLPQMNKNYYPFLVQKTFIFDNNNLSLIDEDLKIEKKTIIICESKLSIPKEYNINFKTKYKKSSLDRTLIFTLLKLIKKREFYFEYVKNEILENGEDINNYNFLFLLIYNNIPVKDIDDIVKADLELLINNKYIDKDFKLKIIYLIPNIGSYNLNIIQNDIKTIKKENATLKASLEKLQKEFDNFKNNK